MKLRGLLIVGGMLVLLVGLVFAQPIIRFPNNFEITLPQLPPQLSQNQIIFNCPYDQNIEYRMVGVRNLTWNGTIPTVTADIKYWTQDRKCAGSKKFELTLPITLSQSALLLNFQNQINEEFVNEALANRQRRQENGYIAGSSGLSAGSGGV